MNHRFVTTDDVLALPRGGELVVGPGDRVTPLARDLARERGVRMTQGQPVAAAPAGPAGPAGGSRTWVPLGHAVGVDRIDLPPFPFDIGRPELDVRAQDVVADPGFPMGTGVMSLRAGSFPWTLQYDEVEYVLEGELHITRGNDRVVGRPGDVITVPKGSAITFGTPSWARFLYVTYPADWGNAS